MSKQQATRRQMLATSSGVLSLAALSSMGVFAEDTGQPFSTLLPKQKVLFIFSCPEVLRTLILGTPSRSWKN